MIMNTSQNKNMLKKGDKPSPPMGRHPILPSASSEPRVHEGQVLPSTPPSPRQPLPHSQSPFPIPSLLTLSTNPPLPSVKDPNAPSPFPIPPPSLDFAAPPPGCPTDPHLPVYFKITSASASPLTTHCPLRLSEALETVLGTDDPQARLQRDGTLLVTATSSHQSKVLTTLHSLGPHPIACTPDALRNSSKGTIFAPHLRNSLPEDILAYLQRKRVPVTHVYRFPPPAATSMKHRIPVSSSPSPSPFHPLPFALALPVALYVLMSPPPDGVSGVKPLDTHSNIVSHPPAAVQTAAHPPTIPALTPPPARTALVLIPPPTPLAPHSFQSNFS